MPPKPIIYNLKCGLSSICPTWYITYSFYASVYNVAGY